MMKYAVVLMLMLSACAKPIEKYDIHAVGPNPATIQGSFIRAEGSIASLGGLIDNNGYVEVAEIDKKQAERKRAYDKINSAGDFSKVLMRSVVGGSLKVVFKPIPISPGRHEIEVALNHGSYSALQKLFITAEANRHYVIRAEGNGVKGFIWIEDDLGRATQKQGFSYHREGFPDYSEHLVY